MRNKLPIILLILFTIFFYSVYKEVTKSAKSKRLECQSKTTTFEKIFIENPIKEAIKFLESNNYEIKSDIKYSEFMKSHLINILTKERSDEKLKTVIEKYLNKNSTKNLDKKILIDYYIYENDKEDNGKKNKDAKSYAGYSMFEFKYDDKLVYKIQTDYMNIDAKDIDERMDCAINSFISIYKKGKE